MSTESSNYLEISKKKLALRNAKFIQEWLIPDEDLPSEDVKDVTNWIQTSGYLSKLELAITESTAQQILHAISLGDWTSLEVTKAFCHRASIAHQLVNCLTEVFFEEAFEQAQEVDKYFEKTGKLLGPFHGLPISLKDDFNVKGQATSIGISDYVFNPEQMPHDSSLVKMLRDSGAVFYVKTNIPVAMMMGESVNHIFGNTCNPLNRDVTCGGSSGGEAALIALKGSVLGVGSDIGGSIRMPSAFQNLYGLRPSSGRFPTSGCRTALPGFESIHIVVGPISSNLETIEYFSKAIVGEKPWLSDPKIANMPWKSVDLPLKLNVAVLYDDGYVRPTAPILRGLDTTVKALKDAGHVVIEWDPSEHKRLFELTFQFIVSDGGKHVQKLIDATGEPLYPAMANFGTSLEIGVSRLWELQAERSQILKKYLDRWNATAEQTGNGRPIDCIIMPVAAQTSAPNGEFSNYIGYTSTYNVLDYSVATLPVSRVDKDIDLREERTSFHSKTDKEVYEGYNPEQMHGAGIALQVVGRRFEEEKVLTMVKVVRDLL